jgi:hypothetical protein
MLRAAIVDAMARVAYTVLPASIQAVYRPAEIDMLALSEPGGLSCLPG